jgi:hypothetical protein
MSAPDMFALGGRQDDLDALRRRARELFEELEVVGDAMRLLDPKPIEAPKPKPRPALTQDQMKAYRAECEEIAAAFRAPLPEGDAGLLAALQRWREMCHRMHISKNLGLEGVTVKLEQEIALPTAYAAQGELEDWIGDTPAEGLVGVAAKLSFQLEMTGEDDCNIFVDLEQMLEVIEREAAR